MTDTDSAVDDETAEHIRPIVEGVVIYDPVFNIALRLTVVTEQGTAIFEMIDHSEGDSMSEV